MERGWWHHLGDETSRRMERPSGWRTHSHTLKLDFFYSFSGQNIDFYYVFLEQSWTRFSKSRQNTSWSFYLIIFLSFCVFLQAKSWYFSQAFRTPIRIFIDYWLFQLWKWSLATYSFYLFIFKHTRSVFCSCVFEGRESLKVKWRNSLERSWWSRSQEFIPSFRCLSSRGLKNKIVNSVLNTDTQLFHLTVKVQPVMLTE